jgi:hypothetical protein
MLTYEDFYELLLEGAIEAGLKVYGEKHNININTCDKTCGFICVLETDEPVYNIRTEISFSWDALQTYQSVYQDIDFCEISSDLDKGTSFNNAVPQCMNMEINYCFDINIPQKTEQLAKLLRRLIQDKIGHKRFFSVETEVILMPDNSLFIKELRACFDLEIEMVEDEIKIITPVIHRQKCRVSEETDMSIKSVFQEIRNVLEVVIDSGEFKKE